MPFSLSHYTIKRTEKHDLYTYIDASYDKAPTRCSNKGCNSSLFTSQGEKSKAPHKICFIADKQPKVMNAERIRWECQRCGTTFSADAEETADWGSDIGKNFRNCVINYWLRSGIKSVYECSRLFGIDRSNLTEWEDALADAFYANQIIEGYEELYFGRFECYKDTTQHAFIAETEEKYGGLVGFVRDYTSHGFLCEDTRYINTDKVKCIRFDYEPGLEETLREMFPNAAIIENPIIDEYEEGEAPHWSIIADRIRKRINKRVGKKNRFNSIMLQMLYNNDRWKQMIQEAGTKAGFTIQNFVYGSWKQQKQTIHKYNGNEKIEWFEIPDDLIEEYDQEDGLD